MLVETKQEFNKFKDVAISHCFKKNDKVYIKIPLCSLRIDYAENNINSVCLQTGKLSFFKEDVEVTILHNAKVTY